MAAVQMMLLLFLLRFVSSLFSPFSSSPSSTAATALLLLLLPLSMMTRPESQAPARVIPVVAKLLQEQARDRPLLLLLQQQLLAISLPRTSRSALRLAATALSLSERTTPGANPTVSNDSAQPGEAGGEAGGEEEEEEEEEDSSSFPPPSPRLSRNARAASSASSLSAAANSPEAFPPKQPNSSSTRSPVASEITLHFPLCWSHMRPARTPWTVVTALPHLEIFFF